jgi:HEAT repeats
MPAINDQSLPPRIRELLGDDTYTRPPARFLTPADIGLLTGVIRNDRRIEEPLSSHRAISVLTAAAEPKIVIPIFEQVARNPAALRTNRIAALRGLGRIGTIETQKLLLEHIHDLDPRVQQASFAALGLFADRAALDTLNSLSEPSDYAASRQLSLARALIAHRNGLQGPFLPEMQGNPREPSVSAQVNNVILEMKGAEVTVDDQSRLRGSTYGIQLARRAYALHCGRAEWTVFWNRDLGNMNIAYDRLSERPWIAALLARWLPARISATTQYILLSRPTGRSVRIDVVRGDGEVMYTGSVEPVGSALSFAISDVDRQQTAPTKLAGLLDADAVRLGVAVVSTTRDATRQTEATRPAGP